MITSIYEYKEHSKSANLYRNTDQKFLTSLIIDKKISADPGKNYISISSIKEAGGLVNFGNVRIIFNKEEILNQGGIIVDYLNKDFQLKHPDIIKHITIHFSNEQEFNKSQESIEPFYRSSWDILMRFFSREREVVIKHITYNDNLIKCVEFKDHNISSDLLKLLQDKSISYSIK